MFPYKRVGWSVLAVVCFDFLLIHEHLLYVIQKHVFNVSKYAALSGFCLKWVLNEAWTIFYTSFNILLDAKITFFLMSI